MNPRKLPTPKGPAPKVGDTIYLRTSMSFSYPWDDVAGGKATISEATIGISAGELTWFISCEGIEGHSYNYTMLLEEQAKLKKEYGKQKARMDPDYNDYGDDDWQSITTSTRLVACK